MNFTGNTALVTGGTRGIGRAIAEGLLSHGATVLITSTQDCRGWWNEHPAATHYVLDLRDHSSTTALSKTLDALERIDVLVNNAGIHYPKPIDQILDEPWDEVFAVNLTGPMRMMRLVVPKMKKYGGRILNVSSISGIVARPGGSTYSASKAGLLGLTRAAALDLAPDGILVNALCPGVTATDMLDRVLTPERKEQLRSESALGRFASPEEIANVALFLVSSLNTYITGQAIVADGGTIIQ